MGKILSTTIKHGGNNMPFILAGVALIDTVARIIGVY